MNTDENFCARLLSVFGEINFWHNNSGPITGRKAECHIEDRVNKVGVRTNFKPQEQIEPTKSKLKFICLSSPLP